MVVKKDGRRSVMTAGKFWADCCVLPAPCAHYELETVADEIEAMLADRPEKEISSREVGQYIMDSLKRLDKVAYVRFASVYREFKDVGEFVNEIKSLLNER
jgi:transcriptional repressor NrdR